MFPVCLSRKTSPRNGETPFFELISNVLPGSLFEICRKIVSGGYGRRRERTDPLDGVLLGDLAELKIGRPEIVAPLAYHRDVQLKPQKTSPGSFLESSESKLHFISLIFSVSSCRALPCSLRRLSFLHSTSSALLLALAFFRFEFQRAMSDVMMA